MSMSKYLRSVVILLPVMLTFAIAQSGDAPNSNQTNRVKRPENTVQHQPNTRNSSGRVQNVENLKEMLKEIGIDDQTIEKIADLTKEYNEYMGKQLIKVHKEELNIKKALQNSSTIDTIKPIVKRKATIVANIEIAQIKRDMTIKSLLTPEELDKWKSQRQKAIAKKGAVQTKKQAQPKKQNSEKKSSE